jgi:hypothetical protein
MPASIPDSASEPGDDLAPASWWQALIRPTVLVEFLFGISPLAAIAYWGWDLFLVLMLHLLALAVSAGFFVLRTAMLSNAALGYFETANRNTPRFIFRLVLTGFAFFALAVPIVLFAALLLQVVGGSWHRSVHSLGDFWRLVVVAPGLVWPLAFVSAWEAISFVADVLLPLLPFKHRLQAPTRPINPEYAHHSRELQAYLFVRAWVVLRMVVMVFGVGLGLLFAPFAGTIAVVIILVALKTTIAVLIEIAEGVDADKRAVQVLLMRARRDFVRRK